MRELGKKLREFVAVNRIDTLNVARAKGEQGSGGRGVCQGGS
jgi:hypothetical protein